MKEPKCLGKGLMVESTETYPLCTGMTSAVIQAPTLLS